MLHNFLNFLSFDAPNTGGAAAPAVDGSQAAPTGGFGSFWFIIIFFILMWVLLILPQRRQDKKHKQMLSDLQKGDKIVTSAGIIGKIVSISPDKIRIRTADKTELDITRSAIGAVMGKSGNSETEESKEDTKEDTKTEEK